MNAHDDRAAIRHEETACERALAAEESEPLGAGYDGPVLAHEP